MEQRTEQRRLGFLRRAGLGAANYNEAKSLPLMLARDGAVDNPLPGLRGVLTFELAPNAPVGFVAAVGDRHDVMQSETETLMQKPIAELLNKAETNYGAVRALSGGGFSGRRAAGNLHAPAGRGFSGTFGHEHRWMR